MSNETHDTEKRERQRLIYITNLDSYSRMAIAATAPKETASFLKDFLYKHVAFQSGIEAKMTVSATEAFVRVTQLTAIVSPRNRPFSSRSIFPFSPGERIALRHWTPAICANVGTSEPLATELPLRPIFTRLRSLAWSLAPRMVPGHLTLCLTRITTMVTASRTSTP